MAKDIASWEVINIVTGNTLASAADLDSPELDGFDDDEELRLVGFSADGHAVELWML